MVSEKHVTASNRRAVCVYEFEKRWEGVQWDASGRSALGEKEDPVNMEDANIGLGKHVEVCLRIGALRRGRPDVVRMSEISQYLDVACIAKA